MKTGHHRTWRDQRRALAIAVAVLVVAAGGCTRSRPTARPSASVAAPASAAQASAVSPATAADLSRFAAPVRRYAGGAGISAQLLMAILYNEAYKPHDPDLERAWQKIDPDAAFGIANMHRATFDETKRGRDFADRDWQELPDNPDLAIEAAAWYLHDLAAQLPASWPARYTGEELLALGYNAGAGSMRTFARGGKPGPTAQSYLDRLHANWDAAAQALR